MSEFNLDTAQKITSGFKTPDGYFDGFSEQMLQQLPENQPKTISLFYKRKTWMYAAAAVLVVALGIPIYQNTAASKAELDKTTLENYLTNHSDITDDDLAELLDEKDIEQIQIDSDIESKAIEDLLSTNSNLEEYLIN